MHPYVRAANITWAGWDFSDVKEMNFDEADYQRFRLHPGDVLVNEGSGSASEVGKPAIWRGQIKNCCFQNTLIRVQPNGCTPEYIHSYFLLSALTEGFVSATQGINIHHIGKEGLAGFAVPVCPLPEQRRIVAKIDSLSARSRRARDQLDHIPRLVENYKQAILAATFNEANFARWDSGVLGEFVREGLVGLVRSKDQQSATSGTPYIRMNHFDIDGTWNDTDLSYVEVSASELSRYELREGDLLFNTRNSLELVGKIAVWPAGRPAHVYNNNLLRLRFTSRVDPIFAGLLMMSPAFRLYLQSVKSATTSVCAIYQRGLMAAPVAFPRLGEQRSIANRIHSAIKRIDRLAAEATSARKLIDTLDQAVLAKAFRGELVPQDPADEPASVLLERVRAERAAADAAKPKRQARRKRG